MQSSKKTSSVKRQRSVSRSPSPRGSPSTTWVESTRKKRSTSSGDDLTQRTQRNIPAFLNKLYSMVADDSTDELIRWSQGGNSFIVEQHELFSKTVLPRFYKHNTFSSFVRQLNMYDFHKVPHLQQGVLVTDSEHELWEFSHPNFQRNRYELLHLVVRKRIRTNNDQQSHQVQSQPQQQPSPLPTPTLQQLPQNPQLLLEQGMTSPGGSTLTSSRLNSLGDTSMQLEHVRLGSLVKDISTIRQHQHAISADLQHLHNDNEILWRETLLAREKHQRHQQVIERILLFLTSVFSNDGFPGGGASKKPSFMLGKQSEYLGDSGNLEGATPNLLIEEAVKLAGISTASLQERFFEQGNSGSSSNNLEPVNSQHQSSQQSNQDQEKGKSGMYRKGVMDPSFLLHALNDLYSIRDTSTPPSHGLNSSAMKSSNSNRCEPTSPATFPLTNPLNAYQPRDQQPQQPQAHRRQPQSHQPHHHQQQHHHYHHPHLQQEQQDRLGHTSAVKSNSVPVYEKDDVERTNILRQGVPSSRLGSSPAPSPSSIPPTPTHVPTSNPLQSLHNLQAFTALTGMVGDIGNGGGDITRIVGLAESLHTATRSAEAISQDIDDLQISIESLAATMGLDANVAEGFDGYLDEFTDNYSNMISMATRNDKMQLFELAGSDSNTQDERKFDGHPQTHHHHMQSTDPVPPIINRDYSTMPSSTDGA